jgi:hypothetical protein
VFTSQLPITVVFVNKKPEKGIVSENRSNNEEESLSTGQAPIVIFTGDPLTEERVLILSRRT